MNTGKLLLCFIVVLFLIPYSQVCAVPSSQAVGNDTGKTANDLHVWSKINGVSNCTASGMTMHTCSGTEMYFDKGNVANGSFVVVDWQNSQSDNLDRGFWTLDGTNIGDAHIYSPHTIKGYNNLWLIFTVIFLMLVGGYLILRRRKKMA